MGRGASKEKQGACPFNHQDLSNDLKSRQEARRRPLDSGPARACPHAERPFPAQPGAWPRPFVELANGDKLPAVWAGEENIRADLNFMQTDYPAANTLYNARGHICLVCGEDIDKNWVYPVQVVEAEESFEIKENYHLIKGGGLHARCAVLAAKFCPAFKEQDLDQAFVLAREETGIDWEMTFGDAHLPETITEKNCSEQAQDQDGRDLEGYSNQDWIIENLSSVFLEKAKTESISWQKLKDLVK